MTPFTPLQRMHSQPLCSPKFDTDTGSNSENELPPPPLLLRVSNQPISNDTNSENELPPLPLLLRVNNQPISSNSN